MSVDFGITADLKWVRSHIVLLLLSAAIAFGAVYGVVSLLSSHDAANDKKWQQILSSQQTLTSALQSQLNSDETKWAAANSQLLASNEKLASAISARALDLSTKIAKDANLTAPDTAKRLGGTANGSNDILLPLPVGRNIVVSLDTLTSVQADLADTKSRLSNETAIAVNLQSNLDSQDKLLSAFRTQADDQEKACKAQVADLKAAARKSKLRWFGAGWVSGMISARLLGI